jgi:hypothetical protein
VTALGAARGTARDSLLAWSRRHERALRGFARSRLLVGGALVAILCAALWPGFAVVLAAVIGVVAVTLAAPAYGFVLVLLLFGAEGSIKILLDRGGTPFGRDPRAVGAALVDLAFAAAVVALAIAERDVLRRSWERMSTVARIGLGLLAAWIAVSALQTLQTGSIVQGLAGFRLTQAYLVAIVAGFLLSAHVGRRDPIRALLVVLGVVAAYAAFRAAVGPADAERDYAISRTEWAYYGDVFRNVGSFSGAVPLASFLVPAAVFAFGLAFVPNRLRLPAAVVFACACIGIITTQTRASIVALVVGLATIVGLSLQPGVLSARGKALAVAGTACVVAVTALGVAVGSRASPETRARAEGLVRPLSDESLRLRFQTWEDTASDIVHHPLGAGVGTVGRASSIGGDFVTTDNSYLKVLREQGILGFPFVIGILMLAGALLGGVWRARARPVGVAAAAGFVSFLVLAVAGEYFEQPGKVLAWALAGIAAWHAWGAATADESAAR